jgi:hypothetical protein
MYAHGLEGTTGIVKGFRMPAKHRREGMHDDVHAKFP